MSFILDALKKSEAERQRQNVPGLLDLGPATPRPRFPAWGIWLGLLLGVNLLVLMGVLIRGWIPGAATPATESKTPTHVATAATKAPEAAPAARPAAAPVANATSPLSPTEDANSFSPMDAPVYAPEIPVTANPVAGTPVGESAATPQYSSGAGNTAAAPLQKPDPRLAKALYPPPPPDEVLPTLNEINLSGNHGIPELHMDIHVYAARPSERFVFFNNRKYREGETLQEGPSVERITREGVVLRFQGMRFSVPRQ